MIFDKGRRGVSHFQFFSEKGGRGVGQYMILADKGGEGGGRGVCKHPFLADIIWEHQPRSKIVQFYLGNRHWDNLRKRGGSSMVN